MARAARCNGTLSEHALWAELERSSPVRWQREVVDGDYRLDFYSRQARVAVEVDGSSHRGRARHDAARDAEVAARGIITVRVSAREVERDVGAVVARVNRECLARTGPVASRALCPAPCSPVCGLPSEGAAPHGPRLRIPPSRTPVNGWEDGSCAPAADRPVRLWPGLGQQSAVARYVCLTR